MTVPFLSRLVEAVPHALADLDTALVRARARHLSAVPREYARGKACHCDDTLPLHLVHSEGLREACDFVVDYGSNVECRQRRQVPVETLADAAAEIADGDRVHVKADWLPDLVEHLLPRIRARFVLVTGDSDYGGVADHVSLLDDDRVLHWFAQNCDVPQAHPKLTRIPIGIDNPVFNRLDKQLSGAVAMLIGRNGFYPSLAANAMGDQALLQRVRRERRRRFADKPLKVLGAFTMRENADRHEAREALEGHPDVHFVRRRLSQEACWRAHDDFAFELSPRGNGLDCLRTWECLFLETIPIVKTSTLDAMYRDEGLPVVIVESFREITSSRLKEWRDELAPRFDDALTRKLTVGYWLDKIERARQPAR